MSFQDRIKQYEERIANSTTPEGRDLARRQRDAFIQTDKRQQLSQFMEILEDKGDINKTLEQYNKRMQNEKRSDAELVGLEGAQQLVQQAVGGLAERAKAAGVDLNAILKEKGLTQEGLQRALLDPKSTRETNAILQEAENQIMTAEKARNDPVAKTNLELKKVNEELTTAVQRLYIVLASFEAIMVAAVALMAMKAGTGLFSLPTGLLGKGGKMLGGLGRGAGRMLGFAGGAAAAAAEAGAAAAGNAAGSAAPGLLSRIAGGIGLGGGAAAAEAGTAAAGQVAGKAAGSAAPGLLSRIAGGIGLGGGAAVAEAGTAAAGQVAGKAAGSAAPGLLSRATGGIGGKLLGGMGVKGLASAGAKLGGLALGASNPIGWVVTLSAAVGGGFVNAMESANKAAEIFNTTQEELTENQKAAAKSAGFLTGVLDSATFGIFSDYIGPTGTWTVGLAKFFDKFLPFDQLGDMLLKPFKSMWDFAKGIGNSMWEGLTWVVTDLPGMIWDGLSSGFDWITKDLPTIVQEAFQGAMDFISELVPGAEKIKEAAGGVMDILNGDVLTGGGKILNAAGGLAADASNTLTNNKLTRAMGINFELFDVGSMGIMQDGLAFLHKGEMVIPEKDAATLQGKATSRGAFDRDSVFGGFVRSLSLGLFDNEQGGEAMISGLDSFVTQMTAPFSSIVGGIGRMIAPVQESAAQKSITDFLSDISANGAETNRLLCEQAGMINTGLFDNTQVSDALYEASEQSNKEFINLFSETDSEPLESVIIQAQEVLLGEASVQDMGLFAPNNVTDALDTMNSESIQQGSLWENALGIIDHIWNNSTTDPSRNNANQPTFWDRATQLWDQLTDRIERAVSNPVETGLFAASNVQESFFESMRNGISNSPIGALANMFGFGPTRGSTTASAGSGLYYNNQSEYQEATTQSGISGETTNNYVNQARRVRGLPLRGLVSSNLLANSGDVEEYIMQRQLLDQPSGGGGGGMVLPILERIAEAVESGRLDEIINLLTAIRDKSGDVFVATGGQGGGIPGMENSKLQGGYNKSWLNGNWTHLSDMSYSEHANVIASRS
jgi:hypothetical protein